MRSKERLVAIRPLNGALCVETMRYADEVLPVDAVAPKDDVKLSEKERDDLQDFQHNQEIIPRRDRPVKESDKEEKSEFRDRQLEKGLDYLRGLIKTATRTSAKKAG